MSARADKDLKPIAGLVIGGEPRANLLPPEVLLATKAKGTRRLLGFVVVLVLILVAGGYGLATIRAIGAEADLAAAQAKTTDLVDQQAQYSEAAQVSALLTASEQTRVAATTNEIIWGSIFDSITANMAVAGYYSWEAQTPNPWEPALEPDGLLREPRVATMTITVATLTPPDATTLFRTLSAIKGSADATLDLVAMGESSGLYESTFTINLTADALANRFAPEEVSK